MDVFILVRPVGLRQSRPSPRFRSVNCTGAGSTLPGLLESWALADAADALAAQKVFRST